MSASYGNFADFLTFTRASAATVRDAADGDRIKWPGHNYVANSEDLANTSNWLATETTTAVVDVPAPVEGQVLEITDAGAGDVNHYIRIVGTTHTSAGNQRWAGGLIAKSSGGALEVWLGTGGVPRAEAKFDLLAGTLISVSPPLGDWTDAAASMTPLGDGWYYVEISARVVTGSVMQLYIWPTKPDGDRTYVADGTNKILVMRPRIFRDEVPMLANPAEPLDPTYYPTKGAFRTLDNLPRGNQPTGAAGKRGLLVEPARTNLFSYSNDLDPTWTENRATLTEAAALGPDGRMSLWRLQDDSTPAATHTLGRVSGGIDNVQQCISFFVRAGERDRFYTFAFDADDTGNWFRGEFDIGEMTAVAASGVNGIATAAYLEDWGGGLYRAVTIGTANSAGAGGDLNFQVRMLDDAGDQTYDGDGASGLYLGFFQCETGTYPTSYIPTFGAAATRVAEASYLQKNLFGTNEISGTWVIEFETPPDILGPATALLYNDSLGWIFYDNLNTASLFGYNGTNSYNYGALLPNSQYKAAVAFNQSSASSCLNGGTVNTNSNGFSVFAKNTIIGLGNNAIGTAQFGGIITAVKFYPRALSDAQLQELTA